MQQQYMVNYTIKQNERALFQYYYLQSTSYLSFLEDFFYESLSVVVPPSRLSDDDNADTSDGGGEEVVWMDSMDD